MPHSHSAGAAGHGSAAVGTAASSAHVSQSLHDRARDMLAHAPHTRGHFHPLPVIGHPAAWYERHIHQAEAAGDRHAKASHKVGQHIAIALDRATPWPQKLTRFCHCLKQYCVPPADADEALRSFYQKLGDLVRRYAGQEALTLARHHHQEYARRLKAGESRGQIEDAAEGFFMDLLGHAGTCPDWCSKEAWNQITEWRDYWV